MMKKYYCTFFLFFILTAKGISQQIDTLACKKIETDLLVISKYILNPASDSQMKRAEIINYLVQLTGIEYSSFINFAGAIYPTQKDYDKWNKWYCENKKRLRWDDKKKMIYLFND